MSILDVGSALARGIGSALGIVRPSDESSRTSGESPFARFADAGRGQRSAASRTPTSFDSSAGTPPASGIDGLRSAIAASRASAGEQTGIPVTSNPGIRPPDRPRTEIRIHDGSNNGRAQLLGDDSAVANSAQAPDEARAAARNVRFGLDYLEQRFGRNGIDDAGRGVDVIVRDATRDASGNEMLRGNAGYYTTTEPDGSTSEALRFGGPGETDGPGGPEPQRSMVYADDLTVHELVHGMIKSETGQLGGDADESGAVNEGLADILAAAATRDWRMGESLYGANNSRTSLRNIANPNDSGAVHGLWETMDEVRANRQADGSIEEHWASGVLSRAAYRMQQRVGWAPVEDVTYAAITSGRLTSMNFADTAAAMRASAHDLWGASDMRTQVVDEELRRAGL